MPTPQGWNSSNEHRRPRSQVEYFHHHEKEERKLFSEGDAIYHGSAEVHRISMLDLERLALEDPLFDPLLLDPEEIYYYATRDAALTTNISAGVRGDALGGFRYDISASSTQSPGREGDVWTHAMTFQLTATEVFGPSGSAGTTLTVGDRDDERRAAFQLYASHNFGNWYVRPRLRLDYVRDSGISKFERYTLTPLLRLDYRGRRARYELQCGPASAIPPPRTGDRESWDTS
ncbi:MAG: hypothetical protein O7G84_06975 [Gammaproteobacteria bacterium]|nr:hypothetical protein [Gammaproteobacteria bacterium]